MLSQVVNIDLSQVLNEGGEAVVCGTPAQQLANLGAVVALAVHTRPAREHNAGTISCKYKNQCFESRPGSGLDTDSIRSVDPYPDPDPGGQKQKKIKKFHVLKCWKFSFEG